MSRHSKSRFPEITDETWTSRNHPVQMICGITATASFLLALALLAIYVIDKAEMPDFSIPDFGPAKQIERQFLELAETIREL